MFLEVAASYRRSKQWCACNISHAGQSLQVDLQLQPTEGASGAGSAVTSASEIQGALLVAVMEAGIEVGATEVAVVVECGDGICSAGEPLLQGADETDTTCMADCPFVIGECPTPDSASVGNAALQCGGNGVCDSSTLSCLCYAGAALLEASLGAVIFRQAQSGCMWLICVAGYECRCRNRGRALWGPC